MIVRILCLVSILVLAGCTAPVTDVETAGAELPRDELPATLPARDAAGPTPWTASAQTRSTTILALAAGSESIMVEGCQSLAIRVPANATSLAFELVTDDDLLANPGAGTFASTAFSPDEDAYDWRPPATLSIEEPVAGEWHVLVHADPVAIQRTYTLTLSASGFGAMPTLEWEYPLPC